MKAFVCTGYGPPEVLKQAEIEVPVPKKDEVLIKVHAAAVTASDIFIRSSDIPLRFRIPMRMMLGITKPRNPVLGLVLSGIVEQTGESVTRFSAGDEVFGLTGFGLGAYAEYKCMKVTDSTYGCLALKPENVTHEESTAAAYGGLLALQFIDREKVNHGSKVLIYGASGTSGIFATQYAVYRGAEVTAVCSGANLQFVKSLGAAKVIDYTVTESLDAYDRFDFIFDAAGKGKTSSLKKSCRKNLAPGGVYASIDDARLQLSSGRLLEVSSLVESGAVKPFIEKIFPFDELPEAHRHAGSGHKRGGIAVSLI